MIGLIFDSCYDGKVLENTKETKELLEAHVFSDVRINRDVECLVLAKEKNMSADEYEVCKYFAQAWALKNKIRIFLNTD